MADAFPISGQIDPKGFPFLVVQLHRRGATGSLKVGGPSYHKALYFRAGRVLFGSSNDPRDQLGAILIEGGKITPEQLEDVNAKVGPGNPLAKVLSDTGFVSQRELSDAARAKVERILCDVLAYTGGTFDFEDGVLPKGAVDLKLSTERLVMAAVRRVGDRNFVLRHIDGLDAVLGPTAEMVPRLGEIEAETGGLPQQLDGRRTLKEAAASARLEEFEAAKVACGLLFLGLVERVRGVTASAAQAVTFADVDSGNELDLGATAAQAFSGAPVVVVPTVEAEAPVTAAGHDEPPPFVVESSPPSASDGPGSAAAKSSETPLDFRFDVPPIPPPKPEAVRAVEAEPAVPAVRAAPPLMAAAAAAVEPEPQTIAISSPPVFIPPPAAPASEPPEVPGPAVPSTVSPLPLVMPERPRTSRPRPSGALAASAPFASAPEPSLTARTSRPSKEDLAALDSLLNSRTAEGPLTPLEKPALVSDRGAPSFARSGGGRRESSSRAPLFLGVAAVLLVGAAAGWYYFNRMGPRTRVASVPSPAAPRATPSAAALLPPSSPDVGSAGAASPAVAATTSAATPPAVPTTTLPAAAATPAPPSPAARTTTPAPAPSPRAATAGAADPRALLRSGSYPEAAHAFASSTRAAGKSAAVIQLLVACSTETVQKAVENASGPELFILPVNYKGRDCYRLCWGVYASEARAQAALHGVPEYFRNGGATPKVLGAAEVLP